MATLTVPPVTTNTRGFRRPNPPTFTDDAIKARYQKGSLALAARIMDMNGWGVGCSIGLSARDAVNPNVVWVLPRGKPLVTIVSQDLIGVDLATGDIVDAGASGKKDYDALYVAVHLAIYNGRPDVNGIVSGHTPYGRVFSTRGEPPKILWQDSCTFYKKVNVLPFNVGLEAAKNPQAVVDALKDGKGLVMQNRGLLTCQGTIEGALAIYLRLENLTGGQTIVEAAVKGRGGELTYVGDEEAQFTQRAVGSEHHAWAMGLPSYWRITKRLGLDSYTI